MVMDGLEPFLEQELIVLAQERDDAEAELRQVLREDGHIAGSIRDLWKCQNSGAE